MPVSIGTNNNLNDKLDIRRYGDDGVILKHVINVKPIHHGNKPQQ